MSPSALPLITEADYPSFQAMIGELRQVTYPEWRDDHLKAVAYRSTRNGSREIPVSPLDFARWLTEAEISAHLELLWIFAETEAARVPKLGRFRNPISATAGL